MTAAHITVIGAGLSGCSAALAAAARGVEVTLYEQRPAAMTRTHQTPLPGELTGTSDLGVEDTDRATGLLKSELRTICPTVIQCADDARISERTMAVDREVFAQALEALLEGTAGIGLRREQIGALPDGPVVIASGPNTWSPLARAIHAAADADFRFSFIGRPPLIAAESIDLSEARWEAPYPGAEPALYLPLTTQEAEELARRLASTEWNEPPGFEVESVLADESQTAERLAADPEDRLRRVLDGPRGPEATIEAPALCLTPDDADHRAYHVEGLLTTLTADAQQEAFHAIGALSEAKILRAGMVHRTPWLTGREATLATLQLRQSARVLLAGTLTGVYGYTEALALGAVAGIGAARLAAGLEPLAPPQDCLTGALCHALSDAEPHSDGRMLGVNFGMLPVPRQDQGLDKPTRRLRQVRRAREAAARYADAN